MKTSDQVAGEAREKLADEIDFLAMRMPSGNLRTFCFRREQWLTIVAALRAQPERGAEEMREPPPGLLMSMALRYDHALGCAGYYDRFGDVPHARKLESTLSTMRQLWEEVTGNGFYKPELEAHYTAALAKLRALPLHPDKEGGGHGSR